MMNNTNSNNTLALVNAEESLRTLKGTEPGDTVLVVHENGQLSLQSVMNRVGHRGRANGHIQLRMMNMGTQGMVDHLLYDTLPTGFVSVMKVQLPRRAEKSASPKTSKTATVTRPSQSESREVTEASQEAQQSTETTVVAEAQAVVETVAVEPIAEAPVAVEALVEEQVSMEVAAEALASSMVPQAEADGGENLPEVQPLSFVSVSE